MPRVSLPLPKVCWGTRAEISKTSAVLSDGTVAILAQGMSWADASSRALFGRPQLPGWEHKLEGAESLALLVSRPDSAPPFRRAVRG